MNPLFTYFLKSSVSLILLFSLFKLTMSRDKNFQVNRFLLIFIILLSSTLPFLNINLLPEKSISQPIEIVQEFVFPQIQDNFHDVHIKQIAHEVPARKKDYATGTYCAILFIFILRTMISLFRVMQLIGSSIKQTYQSVRIAIVKDLIQPFTFFRKIIISETDYKENKNEIISHEMAHISHYHTVDLIICELFTLTHWFNPFAWVLRRDLKLIHEYQADQAVLNKGIDATKYQLLVVKKAVGERRFAMANNFTQCPISKRLKMMNKNNFKRWMQIKLILFVPLGLLLLQAFSRPEIINKQEIRIPILSQQETSESWLQKWVNQQILQLKNPSQRTNPESKSQFKTNHKTGNPEFYLGNVLIAKRNVLVVLNNKVGKILFEGELANHQELTEHIKSIWNGKHPFEKPLPDQKVLELPVIGKTKAPQIIVSYRHDIATPPNEIRKSIEAIGRAFFELREQKSKEYFSKAYLGLNNQEKEAIDKLVPLNISYTEPKMVGSKKK